MKRVAPFLMLAATLALPGFRAATHAEEHRATRLGNPATRFAPPIASAGELRSRFRDPALRPDFGAVLEQWGWKGNLEDLFRAAESAEVTAIEIPVGDRMPFMSTRKNGKPVCLRNVLWAGQEPVQAFAFWFSSNGRIYRCVTPRPCSNFFVEDHGAMVVTTPALAIHCRTPAQQFTGRPVKICLDVSNTGDGPEERALVTLPLPPGVTVTSITEGGTVGPDAITWPLTNVAAATTHEVCAVLVSRQPGVLTFKPAVRGIRSPPAHCGCETKILGIYALLVETIDLEDPIEIGGNITYVLTATNQGDQTGTNLRFTSTLPESQEFVSASGVTRVVAQGRTLIAEPLPALAGKAVAEWRVVTRALQPGDSRFVAEFSSDQFEQPIRREESTHLYRTR